MCFGRVRVYNKNNWFSFMSDIIEHITGEKAIARPACRVAYTLNNSQPVSCTIIGDQPLFYMDFEGDFEEEGIFDDVDYTFLESELKQLKKEIASFDKFSDTFLQDTNAQVESFFEDKDFITQPQTSSNQSIDTLIETLKQSRLAAAYIECMENHNVVIEYNAQVESAEYNRANASIAINPNLSHANQILVTAQELRRHFQHRQGALINPLLFHPDNAVLINRSQSADLIVSMIRIAWELQLAGEKTAWEYIENSSIADLGRAFAREAYLDFRTINNGEAAAAVFEAWFLSERCRAQDKILVQQMLADYQGFVFNLDDASQNITPTLIAALGEMPFGKNYLAEHALTIMNDPIFSDIRDRSNANFLWFIKFERSFRESEQHLQTSNQPTASDIRSDAKIIKTQDDIDATTTKEFGLPAAFSPLHTSQSAEIVTLYADDKAGDKSGKNGKTLSKREKNVRSHSHGANVVYLRRWSGEQ